MIFSIGKEGVRKILANRLIIALGVACAAVLSFYIANETAVSGTVQAQTAFTPYELQMEVYNYQQNPQGALWIRKTEARRSDGATVITEDVTNVAGEHSTRKVTLPDGTITILEDNVSAKTTCHPKSPQSGESRMAFMANPPKSCVIAPGENLTGYEKLLNQTVAVVVTNLSSGDILTDWKAPALGCLTLKYQTRRKQPDGSLKLITDGRPVTLQLQEPDPSLFGTDASYSELLPSQRVQKVFESEGRAWTQSEREAYQRMDNNNAVICQQ